MLMYLSFPMATKDLYKMLFFNSDIYQIKWYDTYNRFVFLFAFQFKNSFATEQVQDVREALYYAKGLSKKCVDKNFFFQF